MAWNAPEGDAHYLDYNFKSCASIQQFDPDRWRSFNGEAKFFMKKTKSIVTSELFPQKATPIVTFVPFRHRLIPFNLVKKEPFKTTQCKKIKSIALCESTSVSNLATVTRHA